MWQVLFIKHTYYVSGPLPKINLLCAKYLHKACLLCTGYSVKCSFYVPGVPHKVKVLYTKCSACKVIYPPPRRSLNQHPGDQVDKPC